MEKQKMVVAVVSDLFFAAKISGAAKMAGVALVCVTSEQPLMEQVAAKPALIMFDLNCDAARPIELIRKLKADPAASSIPLLGFLSHVQTDLAQAATEAGCDRVMPRSAFSASLPQILSAG